MKIDSLNDLEERLSADNNKYVFLFDSFEETLTSAEIAHSELGGYIEMLFTAATKWKSKVSLIIVLRSDALNKLMEFPPPWVTLVENNILFVGPLTEDELRKAIEGPAQYAGLAIEPGLTDLILHDAKGAPGALSLLQYVLRELWERSQQGYLTVEAYRSMGGVSGALKRDADTFFEALSGKEQTTAMAILLRLVRVTVDGSFVRRIAAWDELVKMGQPAPVEELLHRLVEARLVVLSSDASSQRKVELAHEAIIKSWPLLLN